MNGSFNIHKILPNRSLKMEYVICGHYETKYKTLFWRGFQYVQPEPKKIHHHLSDMDKIDTWESPNKLEALLCPEKA